MFHQAQWHKQDHIRLREKHNDSFTHRCSRQPNKYMYTAVLVINAACVKFSDDCWHPFRMGAMPPPPPPVCPVSDGEKSCVHGVTMASLRFLFPGLSHLTCVSTEKCATFNLDFLCFAIYAPWWHLRVWFNIWSNLDRLNFDSTMRCNKQRVEHKQKQSRDSVKRKLSLAVLLFTAQLLLLLLLLCR